MFEVGKNVNKKLFWKMVYNWWLTIHLSKILARCVCTTMHFALLDTIVLKLHVPRKHAFRGTMKLSLSKESFSGERATFWETLYRSWTAVSYFVAPLSKREKNTLFIYSLHLMSSFQY